MVAKLAAAAPFALLVLLVAAIVQAPRHAAACFVPRGSDPDPAAIAAADAAFIGTTIAERPLGPDDTWPHESTLRVLSVLKGHVNANEVVISPLPFHETDCRRGPRLPVGTKALVLMDDSYEVGRPFGLDVYDFDSMTKDWTLPNRVLVLIAIVAAASTAGLLVQVWVARHS